VPGVANARKGEITVEGEPLGGCSDADRRARHALVMGLFGLQKSLTAAHIAARALSDQSADFKRDLASGGTKADSLVAHVAQLQAEVDRVLTATNGLARPIEGWSGAATLDQRRQIDYATEDATKVIADVNRVIQAVIPSLYQSIAKKAWPKPVQPVGGSRK
jgi:hypothetical protein